MAAGAAAQLLTGIPAAWGVFQKPVMQGYGLSRGQAMLAFALLVLRPSECLAALAGYLALGAVGASVFSGMRGGIGMLLGGTGGFLWGFVLGAVAALVWRRL